LKRVFEGKKNFVIPKLWNAVASNSYTGWGIWTSIFHNTWCIWTGITNICREFDLTKTSKSKFPGVCPGGGMSRFRFDSRIISTGGKFVVADQNIAGRNKAPLHLHSKQSRKLARSCFSWRFFAFHSTIYKLTVMLLKIDHEIFVLGWFFLIEWLEEVNMATWTWEQIPYTSSYDLLKTVINEEKREMRTKCKLKFILYASNFPSYVS
jgi:hypothetical protein